MKQDCKKPVALKDCFTEISFTHLSSSFRLLELICLLVQKGSFDPGNYLEGCSDHWIIGTSLE